MTEIFGIAARFLGLHAMARAINKNKVAILLYHDPQPAVFDAHLTFLSRSYNLIPYSHVVEALLTNTWSDLPQNPVVIHIDDGYRGNYELLEICNRHQVEPTLYLCSHVVGTNRKFWSKLADGTSKKLRLVENCRLLEKLKEEAKFTPESEFDTRSALDQSELAAMTSKFDYQSHGRYHFSSLTLNREELRKELEDSRDRIESLTEQSCSHFSFPYGDYSAREVSAVKRAGYVTARTTRPGWVDATCDPFQIPIVADISGTASVNQLRYQLTGIPRFLKRLTYTLVTKRIYAIREQILMSRRFFKEQV